MHDKERKSMVENQLRARGINDRRVLTAMEKIERHLFVNPSDVSYAYEDRPLMTQSGQTISQPYIVALMTQELWLKGDEKVLEIGTGSGYQTAILAELSKEVYSIERMEELTSRAELALKVLKYDNIRLMTGDGTEGWIDEAPFDRILITAAAPKIPNSLFKQLEIGGRMIVPVGGRFMQDMKLIVRKLDNKMQVLDKGRCVFVPLIGSEGWKDD